MTYRINDGNDWSLTIAEQIAGLSWKGPNVSMNASCDAAWERGDDNDNNDSDNDTNGGNDNNNVGDNAGNSGNPSASSQSGAWRFESRNTDEPAWLPGGNECKQVADTFEQTGVRLVRQICFDPEDLSAICIRLIIRNVGREPIAVNRLLPLVIEGSGNLAVGDKPAGQWAFYRNGRHKNDLPSVCILGRQDGAYLDGLKGLTESGKQMNAASDSLPRRIESDQLSVIRGNEGHGPGSLLLGFADGRSQLVRTAISVDEDGIRLDKLELTCLLDSIRLEPGEQREGEWLRLDGNEDSFAAIDIYAAIKGLLTNASASSAPSSVYCTWYYYGQTITDEDVEQNLRALEEQQFPIDVFQIDMGWERRFGDWEANHKFPGGMKAVADRIAACGYRPGIWTAPFIVEPRCDLIYHRPEWLLKNTKGERVTFFMNHTYNFVLDVTHPEVLLWIEQLFRRMTSEWGYTYHKLDFTRAAATDPDARYYDAKATRAEAYRKGIEAVRRGAGQDGYVLICGGLYDAVLGLADGQRTGSDVLSVWPSAGKDGEIAAPLTIKQNILRYWMNRLWHNDPDALMVRRRSELFRGRNLSLGLLTDQEARLSAFNQYWGGGLVCFTEPMREVERDRIGLLSHIVPPIGASAVPRDMFEGRRYPQILDVEVIPKPRNMDSWHTVTIVNWSDKPAAPVVALDERLVGGYAEPGKRYAVSEFWSGKVWSDLAYGEEIRLGEMEPHSAGHLRIARVTEEAPMLLHGNGHFSMGGTEITDWDFRDDMLRIGIDWPWDEPFECLVRAPQNKRWTARDPRCVSDAADGALVRITLEGKYKGIVELALTAKK